MRYFAASDNRAVKAAKIEAILADALGAGAVEGRRILDLGCGSGHIAAHFGVRNDVTAADVVDQVTVPDRSGFRFRLIDGPFLPLDDGSLDIVIYNHVVSCAPDQLGQLREIRRVLKPDGVCYFASANRYFPVEGFTRLWLLHYLPTGAFRALYQRIRKTRDDLSPVGYHGMIRLIERAGFVLTDYSVPILKHPARFRGEHRAVPAWMPVPACILPTIVLVLRK
jgi:SAM-dependent methyltransferase